MISDLSLGGVFVPGLLAIACLALGLTMLVLRLLAATGVSHRLAFRPLIELAVFVIIVSLLAQGLPFTGSAL